MKSQRVEPLDEWMLGKLEADLERRIDIQFSNLMYFARESLEDSTLAEAFRCSARLLRELGLELLALRRLRALGKVRS